MCSSFFASDTRKWNFSFFFSLHFQIFDDGRQHLDLFVGTTKLITIRSRLLFFVFLWTTWLYLLAITLAYSNGLKEFYYNFFFLFLSLQYVVDVLHIKRRWDFDDLLRRNFFRKQTEEFFVFCRVGGIGEGINNTQNTHRLGSLILDFRLCL